MAPVNACGGALCHLAAENWRLRGETRANPMAQFYLEDSHKPVRAYYEALEQFHHISVTHEMAVRSAFQDLLATCARQFDFTLVPEYKLQIPKDGYIKVDGATVDNFRLVHGFWEAKDEQD